MFQTDLLSIIRSLNTVYTAIGICHAEILKVGKILPTIKIWEIVHLFGFYYENLRHLHSVRMKKNWTMVWHNCALPDGGPVRP